MLTSPALATWTIRPTVPPLTRAVIAGPRPASAVSPSPDPPPTIRRPRFPRKATPGPLRKRAGEHDRRSKVVLPKIDGEQRRLVPSSRRSRTQTWVQVGVPVILTTGTGI